jgi:hypothetical protein
LLIISSRSFATTTGPNDQYFLVHDYHDDWQVYNDRMKAYIPHISEQHSGYLSHTIFCDIQSNRGYDLLIYCPKVANFLFINGSLRQKVIAETWIVLNADSLFRAYKQPIIYLTLYGSNNITDKKIMLGYKRPRNQKQIVLSKSGIMAKPRTAMPYRNYIILVSMFILVIFSYVSNAYVKPFQQYFNLKGFFNTFLREQSALMSRSLNIVNIIFVILLSLVIGFFYMLLRGKGIYIFGETIILQEGDTLGILLSNYLRISLVAFILLMVKYFFVSLVGKLFNLEKIVDLYYFKIIQSSNIFYTCLIIALTILSMGYFSHDFNWQVSIFSLTIVFYLVRLFVLYSTIIRSIPIQSLYLISYLCIVEVLPIIISIRFAQ